jgi:glyoxylase-like metal-dependent hydrolase (beta-lactamase superfamily II)
MADDDIPFDKSFDLETGIVKDIAPMVRAICVGNSGPFTFKGTVTYIVGRGNVAVIDPGPDDERHVKALLEALRGETVSHIVLTHTHRDHSPAAAALKAATGAPTCAEGPHRASRPLHIGEINPLDAAGDMDFRPDHTLADGDVIAGDGWTLEAVTTPGHCANHMAYALRETNSLFSGDHVMGWSTSIVAPPDGAMSDYMASLYKIAKRPETVYFPGHGNTIREAPRFVQKGAADIPTLVRAIYIGIDPRLIGAAGLSVLAHLEDLVVRGKVLTEGPPSITGHYRLA